MPKKLKQVINKNTNQDQIQAFRAALSDAYTINGKNAEAWYLDHDDQYIYFEIWWPDDYGYITWRDTYTYDGILAVLGDSDPVQVVRTTDYKVVATEDIERSGDTSLEQKFFEFLNKNFGSAKKEKYPIIKSLDDEQMIAIEPLYICSGEDDLHGCSISDEGVENLAKALNEAISEGSVTGNFFHLVDTDKFTIEKAWVNPCECLIGDTLVPQGQPMAEIQFHDEETWKKRKEGELGGLSINADATYIIEE